MDFKKFNKQVQIQFARICSTGMLFQSSITGRMIWSTYLGGFLPEHDKVFRDPNTSEHDCQCCNSFIRRYGNIVGIVDGHIESIFSNIGDVGEYTKPALLCNQKLVNAPIQDVFFETHQELNSLNYEKCNPRNAVYRLGIVSNLKRYDMWEAGKFGVVEEGKVYEFVHFNMDIPKAFVDQSGKSVEQIKAKYRDKYSVFARAMKELPLDTLQLVKDLINQDSLLDATSHMAVLEIAIQNKKDYEETGMNRELWLWVISYNLTESVAKFKNTLLGTLCTELAEGLELNKACLNWNKRVDPANYHKAKAPITAKQIKEAKKFVEENGYVEAFNRRLATIDDIKASEILHINAGDGEIQRVSMFDAVKPSVPSRHKRSEFDKVEEVSIDKFMKDILPGCTSVEAFLMNSHEGNLVALTTANVKDSKPIFKWANNYSWTFGNNLAGKSFITEAVKTTGGKVDGVLRFSLGWGEGDTTDNSDLDAHCHSPEGEIYYGKYALPSRAPSGGNLDLDITNPKHQRNHINVVENITWPMLSKMKDGDYKMVAHNYAERGNKYFEAEIAFGDELFTYRNEGKLGRPMHVATVTLKQGVFSIKHAMPVSESTSSKELWGLDTGQFHKVNLVCLSPNHWEVNKVGNLHYMFMLNKCATTVNLRGFHIENLIEDLKDHRKVLEVLGATGFIEPEANHLAGIGFNATVRDELIVKCAGTFKRMLKIKF